MPSSPNYKRDYTTENKQQDSPERRRKREQNRKANKAMGTFGNHDGKDVAHKDNNTSNNSKSNLVLQSEKKNRSFDRTKDAKRKARKKK